jgi:hypothetical protein
MDNNPPFSRRLISGSTVFGKGYGMNRAFTAAIAALLFAVGFAGSVAAGPFEDAVDAYFSRGEYATTLRLCARPGPFTSNANGAA